MDCQGCFEEAVGPRSLPSIAYFIWKSDSEEAVSDGEEFTSISLAQAA